MLDLVGFVLMLLGFSGLWAADHALPAISVFEAVSVMANPQGSYAPYGWIIAAIIAMGLYGYGLWRVGRFLLNLNDLGYPLSSSQNIVWSVVLAILTGFALYLFPWRWLFAWLVLGVALFAFVKVMMDGGSKRHA